MNAPKRPKLNHKYDRKAWKGAGSPKNVRPFETRSRDDVRAVKRPGPEPQRTAKRRTRGSHHGQKDEQFPDTNGNVGMAASILFALLNKFKQQARVIVYEKDSRQHTIDKNTYVIKRIASSNVSRTEARVFKELFVPMGILRGPRIKRWNLFRNTVPLDTEEGICNGDKRLLSQRDARFLFFTWAAGAKPKKREKRELDEFLEDGGVVEEPLQNLFDRAPVVRGEENHSEMLSRLLANQVGSSSENDSDTSSGSDEKRRHVLGIIAWTPHNDYTEINLICQNKSFYEYHGEVYGVNPDRRLKLPENIVKFMILNAILEIYMDETTRELPIHMENDEGFGNGVRELLQKFGFNDYDNTKMITGDPGYALLRTYETAKSPEYAFDVLSGRKEKKENRVLRYFNHENPNQRKRRSTRRKKHSTRRKRTRSKRRAKRSTRGGKRTNSVKRRAWNL